MFPIMRMRRHAIADDADPFALGANFYRLRFADRGVMSPGRRRGRRRRHRERYEGQQNLSHVSIPFAALMLARRVGLYWRGGHARRLNRLHLSAELAAIELPGRTTPGPKRGNALAAEDTLHQDLHFSATTL